MVNFVVRNLFYLYEVGQENCLRDSREVGGEDDDGTAADAGESGQGLQFQLQILTIFLLFRNSIYTEICHDFRQFSSTAGL